MKRHSRELIAQLERLGFDHVWTNAAGAHCYVHPGDPGQTELSVSQSITSEQTAKSLLRRAQRIAGVAPKVEKRRASRVKERAETERERARRDLEAARQRRQRLLDTRADTVTLAEAERLIQQRERELAALERLMKQPAQGGSVRRGRDQARHWTGHPQ